MELFACDCLNYVLAQSVALPQFVDVIQGIIPSSHKYYSITHFHVKPSYFGCVYISFTFVFYQSYAAVFAESGFFHNGVFLGRVSVNAMSQNDPAIFTLNDVRQLIYFVSYTARCPRQTKNGRLLFIFRNIKVTVTSPI